jgi:hypothetical protein
LPQVPVLSSTVCMDALMWHLDMAATFFFWEMIIIRAAALVNPMRIGFP